MGRVDRGVDLIVEGLRDLSKDLKRVSGLDTPFPYSLEMEYLPLAHRILPALIETARF